ncbi:hypothetical protein [Streptomyces sp. NBC_01237]|uniref:hypothetical protein n=1 Tax=Streptomyces sp. NBC_01237 TaxID=2903790 RepID=UPI002DD9CBC5|nr:hypothetical protein [Streptomyces sp. NBC_01237]WRZ72873.1 hypothetical protein OG251_15245 [Streptomyces sp. NBC_01237]
MTTTAQKVIAYRRELLEGGLAPELVDDLVKDAASTLVMSGGLVVMRTGTAQQPRNESLTDQHANPRLAGTD